jgi:gluconate 2-dehydrogenase gamma chain
VRVLCDLIIPADERSGSATEAGVPEFIDDWLDFRKQEDGNDDLPAQILGGLAWLDRESARLFGKRFADAAPGQQTQMLDRIAWPERAAPEDRHAAAFFSKLRDLTASGFFSSKMGVADLPYLGNVAVADWKGCDPGVWAKIEDRMKNGYKGVAGEVKP